MNDESKVLPRPKKAFSDVLEGVVFKICFRGKPPYPQWSFKQVETLVNDKCFHIDHLHLKGSKFIAIEKRSQHHDPPYIFMFLIENVYTQAEIKMLD